MAPLERVSWGIGVRMYVFLPFFFIFFGIPEISCNLYNPGGDFTGYWGPFVKGPTKALVGWVTSWVCHLMEPIGVSILLMDEILLTS